MNGTTLPAELPRPIADALDRGATVITANQRAARTIRNSFDWRQRHLGALRWHPAAALAWDEWTAGLWRSLLIEGQASELLLSHAQEHAIWRSIISADPELRDTLRSADSVAEMATEAWRLVARYNAQRRLHGSWGSFDARAFQRWATEFERRCRTERWLPLAALENTLHSFVQQGRVSVARDIVLVGFDELSPAQQRLLDAVTQSDTLVENISLAVEPDRRVLVRAEDEQEEIAAAARWARRLLEEQPEARVAVVVPSLENRRASINRVFRQYLAPELEDIEALNKLAPYEFSIGIKLADTPMVRIALDLLRWIAGALHVERVSALLVSPLFAMEESERNARATFDAFELRKARILRPEVSLGWLAETIAHSKRRPQLTHLFTVLRDMASGAQGAIIPGERRPYAFWADTARALLQTAQWGRRTGEDSSEFQTRRKWERTLDQFAMLDFDGSQVSYLRALSALERLTRITTFAEESHQAPVQILGPLEAAGSSFEAVWFLGANDMTWPVTPAANPLLPWALQREFQMPGTDTAADDARARRTTHRIAASAATSVFSYAAESSAGKQRPSPMLDALQLEPVEADQIAPVRSQPSVVKTEEFADCIPIRETPDRIIQGGADILRLQAACGFRAFAERRLWSAEMRTIEMGMDAGERGTIVHQALEHFWTEVESQSHLKEMTTDQRAAALERAIEHGLRRTSVDAAGWDQAYVDVQRARLRNLLGPWLELELNRDPFSVKLSEKSFSDVRIGPLRLNVRVDRVDVGEDGEIIIDYKTGRAEPRDWQTDRPEAPQLPLYAVLATAAQPDIPLADVAFALIRPGKEMALEGFAGKVTAQQKKSNRRSQSLEEQVDTWRRVLTDLAEDFHRGDARVDPKQYPRTCSNCAQRILCRLDPTAFDEEIDDEETVD
jgi:probable DNA repair protein